MSTGLHQTVLLAEAVEALVTQPDGLYVDGTFGRGGHARALLQRLSPAGRLVAFDRDPEAVAAAAAITDPRFVIVHASYAEMGQALAARGVLRVSGVLLDLGVSSPQLDTAARGFSFRFDAPLDMRMDPTRGETAADFLARADERDISWVLENHGEERFARKIARALVARREGGSPVRSTGELAALVAGIVKTREPGQDPATRTFQGLRIHVNAELEALEQGLNAALALLAPGGRLVVISFHSLEDRIVKRFIADRSTNPAGSRYLPEVKAIAPTFEKRGGAVGPSEAEIAANPRSRSAKLRAAVRTSAPARAADLSIFGLPRLPEILRPEER